MDKLIKFKDLSNNDMLNFKELATTQGGANNQGSACIDDVCLNYRDLSVDMCAVSICYNNIGACKTKTTSTGI